MKRGTRIGRVLLRLLACYVATTAACPLILGQAETDAVKKPRLALGVLIDTSTHQERVIEFEREVLSSFADRFDGLGSESFVITYGDKVNLLQDWSPPDTCFKTASTRIGLDLEGGKTGRTLLNDALKSALLKLAAKSDSDSKALIVIGEGNDLGSRSNYSQIKKMAKSSHVRCFAMLIASHDLMGGRVRHFGFDLYDLAGTTKGNAYDVGTSRKHLDKATRDLLKRIR